MGDGHQATVVGSRYQRDIGSRNIIETVVAGISRTLGDHRSLVVVYEQRLRSRSSVATAIGSRPSTNNLVRLRTVTRNDCLCEEHFNRVITIISSRYISRSRDVVAAHFVRSRHANQHRSEGIGNSYGLNVFNKISTFINSIVRTADDHFTLITDFNIIGESDGNQSTAVVFSLKLGSVRSRNFIVALEEKIFRYYSEYWWSSVFNSDCLRRDIHVT